MPVKPRPEIENIAIAVHGGPNYAEMEKKGVKPADVIDFSVSSNPCGTLPKLKATLNKIDVTSYPDSEALTLRRKIATATGLTIDHAIAGNGSAETIWLVALAFIGRGDSVLIVQPTFGEYEVASRIMGATVVDYRVEETQGFRPNITDLCAVIKARNPKVVFVCNPNNPTGQYLSREELTAIIAANPATLVVVDEAYVAFVDQSWDAANLVERGNVLFLRSMTKDYALAGLRIGYAIAAPDIIRSLRKVRPPWNVNSYALAAGILAFESESFVRRCTLRIAKAKDYLMRSFQTMGLSCVPSEANFFLVKVDQAASIRERLLAKGILVRDCTSFGLPQFIRIAPRTMPECQKLVAAMREITVNRK